MDFDSTMQTVAWIKDRYQEGNLEIKPPYQRNPVWAARQKCFLVESILLQMPIPEIYIQQITTAAGTTKYAVVDGQQRIRSVLQFVGGDQDADQQEFNKFILDKLPTTSKWHNKSFSDIGEADRKAFYKYKFSVRQLNTESEDEVRDMFVRLNKFVAPLKPPEIRHATFKGPFAAFVERLADEEYWAENKIVTAAAIRRMADVEFVAELVILLLHGPQGGSSAIVDDYYIQYEDHEDEFPGQKKVKTDYAAVMTIIQAALPDIKDTRWSNKTDFYSLFGALAVFVRDSGAITAKAQAKLRSALDAFESQVDARLKSEHHSASRAVLDYVAAVEKGANDKARRARRQELIGALIAKAIA